jgi:hypothetical protein
VNAGPVGWSAWRGARVSTDHGETSRRLRDQGIRHRLERQVSSGKFRVVRVGSYATAAEAELADVETLIARRVRNGDFDLAGYLWGYLGCRDGQNVVFVNRWPKAEKIDYLSSDVNKLARTVKTSGCVSPIVCACRLNQLATRYELTITRSGRESGLRRRLRVPTRRRPDRPARGTSQWS